MNLLRKALNAILSLWEDETEKETYERLTAARNRGLVRFINESTDFNVDSSTIISISSQPVKRIDDSQPAAVPAQHPDFDAMDRDEIINWCEAHAVDFPAANYKRVDHLRSALRKALASQ